MVDAHQAAAVGEYSFYLKKIDHISDTFHHLFLLQDIGGVMHYFFYCLAFASAFECA